MTRTRLLAPVLLALPLLSAIAHAQEVGNEAMATRLFTKGQQLMAQKNYAEACPKFVEAAGMMANGVGVWLSVGQCLPHLGQTASALAALERAKNLADAQLQRDPKDTRTQHKLKLIREELDALRPKLTYLKVSVSDAARVAGLTLKRGTEELGSGIWNEELPVDQGTVSVTVSAPGFGPQTLTVEVSEPGKRYELVVPKLIPDDATVAVPLAAPGPMTSPAPAMDPPAPSPQDSAQVDAGGSSSTWGWIGVGVGAVGIGLGAVFYLQSQSKFDDANCPNECATDADKALHDDARSAETMGLIFGIGGAVIAAAGITIILTSGSDSKPSSALSISTANSAGMLLASGRF